MHPSAGNLAPQSEIYPGYEAPVIRLADDGERELVMMAWGFVLPQQGRSPKWVNNTRDDKVMSSGFWKSSFIERRCLIPATSFAEYHPTVRDEKGHKAGGVVQHGWWQRSVLRLCRHLAALARRLEGRAARDGLLFHADHRAQRTGATDPPDPDAGHRRA